MVHNALMFEVIPLPAFKDNYLWLLVQSSHAVAVDPGDANVITQALQNRDLSLQAILLTHHHADHTGGAEILQRAYGCPVFGPERESIAATTHPVSEGHTIQLLGQAFQVMDVPGHTRGHIAYWCKSAQALFCGDTLFAAGCGRLFEGTPQDMWQSLQKIAALPDDTRIYCAHEYTAANLQFARAIEPANLDIQRRQAQVDEQRARGEPSVPSTLALEHLTNPFLRAKLPTVKTAVAALPALYDSGKVLPEPIQTFARLRVWKDHFRADNLVQ
ncbi:MAG: hydroxyacylglutathione hydrolase [Burkholderiales bacterium]|jgi:hydroxyacylglutathione hydrolase